MATIAIDRCYRCGAELPPRPPGRGGHPRRYCSDRCRQAAYRSRRQIEPPPELAGAFDLPPLPLSPPPDELLAQAILEARGVAATLASLAPVVRREFAWRCECAARDVRRAMDSYFPV